MRPVFWLLGIGAFAALVFGGRRIVSGWLESANAQKYLPLLNAAETRNGIPRNLLARMAYQESRFRDDIISGAKISSAGAVGIMQIVPRWHPELGADGARDPRLAIPYAAAFLRSLYNSLGSWQRAVAAYNWGQGNLLTKDLADGIFGDDLPEETRRYVAEVWADLPNAPT